jgi:hypothetical protein
MDIAQYLCDDLFYAPFNPEMKKPKDVTDLAARLAGAASAPLVAARPADPESAPREASRAKQVEKVSVFLRLEKSLHERYEALARARTMATGDHVTVQKVITEQLEKE